MVKKTLLNDTPENLIKKYKEKLAESGITFEKVILFGSYARGNPRYESDIDLCVVSKLFGKNPYDEMVLLNKLTIDIEPMIEPHPYHPKDLDDKHDPLACEIKKTGKVV